MKYSIVFPGQGSQSLGMLSNLNSNFSVISEVFQEASDALGVDLWKIAQENQKALNLAVNTQPLMLASGYATYRVLSDEVKLSPVCFAGHSLGEYTALVASKSLDFFDAVKLVRKRAELMQSAVPIESGSMVAILGLDDQEVIKLCKQASEIGVVEAVNFNSPGQVVIAGEKKAVVYACDLLKKAGAKRALPLPVSVPSHCSLMKDAAIDFKHSVKNVNFKIGNEQVIHNVDAKYSGNIEEIKSKLVEQFHKPVLWTLTVQNMKKLGVEQLIEAGPGKVLAGLTKRIDKSLSGLAIIDVITLQSTIEEILNA
jgi:[acyl-carrier-protein] S-malonyltransferase